MEEEVIQQRQAICKQLSALAQEKGFTQEKLAQLTGLKQESISRIFGGRFSPRLDLLLQIANAMKVSIILK